MPSKKILFITLSNIGDAVMTLPTFEFLNNKYPESYFDFVCDKRSVEIFKYLPNVRKIFIKNKKKGLLGNFFLIKELRKKEYDIAVDLRTDIYLYFIRAKEKFFKISNNNLHSIEKHFMSVEKDLSKLPSPKIYIPKTIFNKNKNFFFKNQDKTISVALGANSSFKIWPTEKYIALLNQMSNKFDQVFLLGDIRDYSKAEFFKNNYKNKSLNLCGKLSLLESAAIIEKSDFFIGNDSGLGHIASALNIPCFIIFGEGNPLRYRPWGNKSFWYQSEKKDINDITVKTIYEKSKVIFK